MGARPVSDRPEFGGGGIPAPVPLEDAIRLAFAAGFRGNDLVTAVAVAMAESGLHAQAQGDGGIRDNTWGYSVGLWQIRSLNKDHNTGRVRDDVVNVDPWRNAQAAFELYRGRKGKFTDWSAFKNGNYKQFLGQVRDTVNRMGGDPALDVHVREARANNLYIPSLGQPPGWRPSGVAGARPASDRPEFGGGGVPTATGGARPASDRPDLGGGGVISGGGGTATVRGAPTEQIAVAPQQSVAVRPSDWPSDPAAQEQYIRDHWGAIAWLLDNPDVRPLLFQLASGEISQDQYDAKIIQTPWYQHTTDAQRSWDTLQHTDPGEMQRRLEQRVAEVRQKAVQTGVHMDEHRLFWLSLQSLRDGWDDTEVGKAIANEFHYNASGRAQQMVDPTTGRPAFTGPNGEAGGNAADGNVPAGATTWTMPDGRTAWYFPGRDVRPGNVAAMQAGQVSQGPFTGGAAASAQQMREQAAQFGVTLSDADLAVWVGETMKGNRTPDDFAEWLRRQASGKYTYWADEIQKGFSPMELANGYIQSVARLYGRNVNTITLDDPDIRAALSFVDPKTGKRSEMGDWGFEQYLKRPGSPYWTDPKNQTAKGEAVSVGMEVLERLGVAKR